MIVFAIDPGTLSSGFVLADVTPSGIELIHFGKAENRELLQIMDGVAFECLLVEMVASYGMTVGAEIFETCVWIGQFLHAAESRNIPVARLKRKEVVSEICGSSKAKDGNVRQALIDIYGAVGTKHAPGYFYGFAGDIWQAFALLHAYKSRGFK